MMTATEAPLDGLATLTHTEPETSKEVMSVFDVAERWGVDTDAVWRAVDDPDNPLPSLYLGRGVPRRGGRGPRGNHRFLLSTVRAWEQAQQRHYAAAGVDKDTAEVAKLAILKHDGKVRGGKRGKRGPRG